MEEWFDVTSAFESCTRRVSYQGLYEIVSDGPIAPDVPGYLYQSTQAHQKGYLHFYRHVALCSSENKLNDNLLGTLTISL